MAHGEHSAQVIVHRSGEDAAENYPQVGRRTELGAHYRAEYRAGAGDVEELDHEDLPTRKHYVVNAVGHAHGRRRTVVRSEDALHNAAVDKVAHDEGHQT